MATDYLYMIRDLQPFPSLFTSRGSQWKAYRVSLARKPKPGRKHRSGMGKRNQLFTLNWMNLIQSQSGVPWTDQNLINLNHFIGAKALLRLFTFYSHKGLETACVFAARDNEFNLSVIPEAFFSSLDATGGQYSNDAWMNRGAQLQTIGRLTNFFNTFAVTPSTFTVQPLTVTGLSEPSPRMEFSGDGTPAHPDRYNVDDFGVFPFQLNQITYAVGYYVVTRNIVQNWGVNSNILDTSNYSMPDETFDVTLSGLANGLTAQVLSYDPLKGYSRSVTVLARSQNSIQVRVLSTDYPRFLLVIGP